MGSAVLHPLALAALETAYEGTETGSVGAARCGPIFLSLLLDFPSF